MGEIRVAEDCDQCECLVIVDPDRVIELYERKILQDLVREDYSAAW